MIKVNDSFIQSTKEQMEKNFISLHLNLFGRTKVSAQKGLDYTGSYRDILNITCTFKKQLVEVERTHDLYKRSFKNDFGSTKNFEDLEIHTQACFEFATIVKAMLFFIRAYQDLMYQFIMHTCNGAIYSDKSYKSMKEIIDSPKNPVHIWLNSQIPEYYDWFVKLRDIRNDLKLGQSHGIEIKDDDIWINLHRNPLPEEETNHTIAKYKISVPDIVACLVMTSKVTAFLSEELKDRALIQSE